MTAAAIERREQRDGSVKWAVLSLGQALTKSGEWEYEPLPSWRDAAYLDRARFDSFDAALAAAHAAAQKEAAAKR